MQPPCLVHNPPHWRSSNTHYTMNSRQDCTDNNARPQTYNHTQPNATTRCQCTDTSRKGTPIGRKRKSCEPCTRNAHTNERQRTYNVNECKMPRQRLQSSRLHCIIRLFFIP